MDHVLFLGKQSTVCDIVRSSGCRLPALGRTSGPGASHWLLSIKHGTSINGGYKWWSVRYATLLNTGGFSTLMVGRTCEQQDSTVLIHQWTWLGQFFTCNMQLSSVCFFQATSFDSQFPTYHGKIITSRDCKYTNSYKKSSCHKGVLQTSQSTRYGARKLYNASNLAISRGLPDMIHQGDRRWHNGDTPRWQPILSRRKPSGND